jgi:Flp pilus assembly protein TadG
MRTRDRIRSRTGRISMGAEDGSAVETAIVFPAIFIAIMMIIQGGLAFHAQHVALAAAQEGDRAARLFQATDADGLARANQALQALNAGGILTSPQVSVSRSGGNVTVTVRGGVVSLLPGVNLTIRPQVSEGPVEVFTGPGQ